MFRYVSNEFSKLFNTKSTITETYENYTITSSNNTNNNNNNRQNHNNSFNFSTKNVSKTQNLISKNPTYKSSATTDLNNNDILDISLKNKNSKKINKRINQNKSSVFEASTSLLSESQLVSVDEFDWFNNQNTPQLAFQDKQINKLEEFYNFPRQARQSYQSLVEFLQENSELISLASSYDTYYEDLNKEFCFDNLKKSYSPNTKFRQQTFKMLTSFDRDEFLYTYLDTNADNELVDTLKTNALKAVQVFQKTYYQEAVKGEHIVVPSWRMKEKIKTVNAALIMCLNIGVDPPDVVKTSQCSKLECWINQMTMNPQKALEQICAELQKQYERWQPRARYKHSPDPTAEDVKKLCISLRKNAKEERVLFHYNGHGVPKPTVNGEIWVFNKEFTQYIPLSLYEVQTWMGSPSFYVWDCSNAGIIIQNFLQFEEDRENEANQKGDPNQENIGLLSGGKLQAGESMRPKQSLGGLGLTNSPKLRDSIHLAACGKNELLPMHPDLPLDLFTACLTTPIKAALHWYVSQKNLCQLVPGLTLDLLEKIPGLISDRRTMMGELHWIFTAITDTIAWNVLDSDLFQKLFRQDLLVASLFRNFLLAERIMKSLDCTPVSHPALPSTHEHPLWQSWDLALDMCISQLPQILNTDSSQQPKDFISCGFFTEQIEIFDVWLRFNVNSQTPPEQLPVVLQVLLSQQHRLKALELLGKFLDFGPWAVSSALSVGIFPYVLKLLTTQPKELRPLLTFIWAKILAVDKSCQVELVKDKGHSYFIQVLNDPYVEPTHKVYSVFVLSCLVDNYPAGQESAKQNHLIALCTFLITDKNSADYKNSLLRQWCCICLGLCWQNYPEARWEGVRNTVDKYLIELISDPVPEVRAAAIFALGTYIGCGPGNEASQEQTNELDKKIVNALIKDYDISFIVRKELIAALFNYINQFIANQPSNSTIPHTLLRNSENSSGISSLNSDNSSVTTDSNKTLSKSQSSSTLSQQQHHHQANAKINTIQEHQSNSASASPLHSLTATKRERLISQPSLGQANTSMPIRPNAGSPVASILPYSNKSFYVIFNRVWSLLVDMQNDPYPDVAEFAQKVVGYFLARAQSFDLLKRNMILQQQQGVQTARRFSSDLTNKSNQPGEKMKDEGNEEEDSSISTEYVQWCRKYFLKPLLPTQPSSKTEELLINRPVDIYTAEFLDQHCKLLYNHKVKRRVPNPWHDHQDMDEGTQIKHNTLPVHCKFHPYDDMLFISDKDSLIHVYDLQNRSVNQPKLSFNNVPQGKSAQVKKSVITSFKVINAQHEPMILTGTEDRVVRLFKPDLMYYRSNQLVTAFTGFGDKEKENSSQKEAGLIIEWDEPNEVLMCAGDTSHIRVWDMNKELYTDYQTNVRSCVSSLSTNSSYTVAGFGDGTIKLFDFRRANPVSLVSGSDLVYQHNVFVLKAQIHRPSNKLISSSTRGDVNIFDIRNMQGCLKSTINNQMATALECHPINELFAIANHNQSINVYDFKGKELASIKYHEGFMRKRIAAVTCLDWNCYKNEIVFGSQDNYLSVFSCKENSY